MITKAHIISEIKRTAKGNGGAPLGVDRFPAETGIKSSDWVGKFWARWGDALVEAGLQPNALQGPRSANDLLENLARLTRELRHFPVANEIKLKARSEPGFPWHYTYSRFGGKQKLAATLREFALAHGYEDVASLCDAAVAGPVTRTSAGPVDEGVESEPAMGYVYLLKSGRFHKVGRSNAVGRRERELSIQLPQEATVVHSIKTDDPVGIEHYWHRRFADRRKNGEWFELTAKDVAAFKRRKFM